MNDQNDVNQIPPASNPAAAPPPPPVGFCQQCGRPLDRDAVRIVGHAVYCEPCLAARLAGAAPPPGYAPVDPGSPWTVPPVSPILPGAPNPSLAALLGFIPGVGAMYNEQYAKGIVHLIVFAVLVSLADSNGIFGLFIAGWEFYMAIEAHHTAKARRDGLPLPNPFGLNDIGERLGFGKAWTTGQTAGQTNDQTNGPRTGSSAVDAAQAGAQGFGQTPTHTAGFGPQGGGSSPAGAGPAPWGSPTDSFPPASNLERQAWQETSGRETKDPSSRNSEQARADAFGTQHPYTPISPYPVPPYPVPPYASAPPYGSPAIPPVPPPAYLAPVSRFPAGAVWLIGLGCLFLLMTTGLFRGVGPGLLFGFGLIGLGVWSFLRRMAESGTSLHNDGSSTYSLRIFRALRLGAWLILIGTWFLLDTFHVLRLHSSWPLFIILAGVMALLERVAYNAAANQALSGWPLAANPADVPASSSTTTPAQHAEKDEN